MTPEQQREQWLKRILPALGITVIYFVFISPYFVVDKPQKLKTRYELLQKQGIDEAMLSALQQQQLALRAEISRLEQEEKTVRELLENNSILLSQAKSPTDTLKRTSVILANNNLQVLDEKRIERPSEQQLPKSLRDTRHWLQELFKADEPAVKSPQSALTAQKKTEGEAFDVWTIRYTGAYLDNYRALSNLVEQGIKALPVSLTMQASQSNPGQQEWLLTLWL